MPGPWERYQTSEPQAQPQAQMPSGPWQKFQPDGPKPKAKPEGVGGTADALLRGAAQGATLGFADEITAGVGGLRDYVQAKLGQRGDISLSDAYYTNRNAIRKADAKASEEHPYAFTGGQVAGGLATAFAPGLGALNVGKGAGIAEAVGKGAAMGAIAGTGQAHELTDVPKDALTGAAIGGVTAGALHVGGKVVRAAADKLKPEKAASVLLNAPEDAVKRYIKDPSAVNAARSRADIVEKEFLPRIERLQDEVSGGSTASRAILDREGNMVSGDKIAGIMESKAKDILARAEGVLDDPQKAAAVRFLQDSAAKYRSGIPDEASKELAQVLAKASGMDLAEVESQMLTEKARQLSTNRVKDLIQTLDRTTEYSTGPGQFSRIDDVIKRDVRNQIDTILKEGSPAYAEQMKKVAEDTRLLKEVADLAKSPQGFDNLLKRTQRGNTPHLMDALKRFDERTGGNLLQELQDSAVKDALNRGAMNGSRNVNLHGAAGDALGEAVGGLKGKLAGRIVGLLQGATVDKYGPQMAKKIVDSSIKLERLIQSSEGLQRLGAYAQPLIEAARNGNQSLAATHAALYASDAQYRRVLAQDEDTAVKRRIKRMGE